MIHEEKYFGVTDDFDEWCETITKNVESFNESFKGASPDVVLNPEPFKDCKYFLTYPVGLLDNRAITAKSMAISEDEINDFVDATIVPYMYIKRGTKKILRYYKIEE